MIIIDKETYKLTLTVKKTITNENLVTLSRWIPETDWAKMEMYLTDDELGLMRKALFEEIKHG